MAQASVTGPNLTQIQLHVHGQAIEPLNVDAARHLWGQLGDAIQTAEHNRSELQVAASPAEDAAPEEEPAPKRRRARKKAAS